MHPSPIFNDPEYIGSSKLKNKVALITGGDSGIGRAVSLAFAKEGADIAIVYLYEHIDAETTKGLIESLGRSCVLIPGDLREENFCKRAVEITISTYNQLDILVNNAGVALNIMATENKDLNTKLSMGSKIIILKSIFFPLINFIPLIRTISLFYISTSLLFYPSQVNPILWCRLDS